MQRVSRSNVFAQAVIVAMAMLALTGRDVAAAVTKPFKVTGGGVAPDGLRPPGETTTHVFEGQATELGRHSGSGDFDIFSLAPDSPTSLAGTFASADPCVFEAANGDELVCYYGRTDKGASGIGTFEITFLGVTTGGDLIVEAEFIAEFVVQPVLSTGRFAGATGNWIMYATTAPFILGSSDPVEYSWEGEGTLTFPKLKK
jgi:hypothetical protein